MRVHREHMCVTCLILTNPARRLGSRASPAFHRRNSGSEKMNSHKAGPQGSPVGPFSDLQFQGIPHHGALPRNNHVMPGFMRPQGREPVLWKCSGKKPLAAMVGLKPRTPHSRPGFLGALRVHIEHFRLGRPLSVYGWGQTRGGFPPLCCARWDPSRHCHPGPHFLRQTQQACPCLSTLFSPHDCRSPTPWLGVYLWESVFLFNPLSKF